MIAHGAVLHSYGDKFIINWQEIDVGEPLEGQVTITVEASVVNFADLLMVQGKYQDKPDLPFVPGKGVAGVITQVGVGVEKSNIGKRVLAWLKTGGFQTKVNVSLDRVFGYNGDSLKSEQLVAGFLPYLTARVALLVRGQVNKNDSVLITGVAGSVGKAAAFIAKKHGVKRVIGVARNPDRVLKEQSSFYSDQLAYYSEGNVKDKVLELTNGNGVSLVIENVGGSLFHSSLSCLSWGGKLVVVGFASGEIPSLKAGHILVKGISITGFQVTDYLSRDPEFIRESINEYIDAVIRGEFKVPIKKRLPLKEAGKALLNVSEKAYAGKIVLYQNV